MLNYRTRNDVRAPFQLIMVKDRVQEARTRYLKLLPEVVRLYKKVVRVFVGQLQQITNNAALESAEYMTVMKRFEALTSLQDFDRSASYDETLKFLENVSGETIMLSQAEYAALDKEDEALTHLQEVKKNLTKLDS